MPVLDGDNYTQLTFLNVTEELRVQGVPLVGGGDVSGPGSAGDTNIAIFDGVTGKIIMDSGVIIDGQFNVKSDGRFFSKAVEDGPGGFTIQSFAGAEVLRFRYNDSVDRGFLEFFNTGTAKIFFQDEGMIESQDSSITLNPNTANPGGPGVAIGGTAPVGAVSLDLRDTDRALRFNRMTVAQRDNIPTLDGMAIFNTTTSQLEVWNGSTWAFSAPAPQIEAFHGVPNAHEIASAKIAVDDNVWIFTDATGVCSPAAPITITTEGSEQITGQAMVKIEEPYGSLTLISSQGNLYLG